MKPFGLAAIRPACRAVGLLVLTVLAGCTAHGAQTLAASQSPAGNGGPTLVGVTSAALQSEFGTPDLLRRDGPAQVWLYRTVACTVALILYPDQHTGIERVAVANVLPPAAPGTGVTCLAGLSEQPRQPAGRVAASQ